MTTDTQQRQLTRYIGAARRREGFRIVLQWLLATLLAATIITAVVVFIGMQRGFSASMIDGNRVLLLLAGVVLLAMMLIGPLNRLRRDKGRQLLESADTAFNGRIQTYLDTREQNPEHTFLPLLATDANKVAKRIPLSKVVPTGSLLWPLVCLLLSIGSLTVFFQQGPQHLRNAAQHLWMGWQKPGLIEERALAVTPGDINVLAGSNLDLLATTAGFDIDELTFKIKNPGQDWQSTSVERDVDGKFRFILFRLDKSLVYSVDAQFIQSPEYQVTVIEPAKIEQLQAHFVFPEWTKLEPTTVKNAGAIAGVKNTQVTLDFVTDKPLTLGALELGNERLALSQNGNAYSASFVLSSDSHYQIVDQLLGQDVAISSEYPISIEGDEAPQIAITQPGRDVSASPVEEVHLQIEASDDFSIESVSLHYSINAGDWQVAQLDASETNAYVFNLEELGEPSPGVVGPMVPGDLISYFARVTDHDSEAETDMLLIDVRPFDRRFSEGQSSGGPSGSSPGNEGTEISRRQKEIYWRHGTCCAP